MTMITPSYLGETIEYSSLHACRSTLEDPTKNKEIALEIWGKDLNSREHPDSPEFKAHFEKHYAADYWNHASEEGKDRGFENAKMVRFAFKDLFEDAAFEITQAAADGDLVMLRGLFSARNTGGRLFGIPADGRPVSQEQVHILGFDDEHKITDHWVVRDDYVMFKQMSDSDQAAGIVRFAEESRAERQENTDG